MLLNKMVSLCPVRTKLILSISTQVGKFQNLNPRFLLCKIRKTLIFRVFQGHICKELISQDLWSVSVLQVVMLIFFLNLLSAFLYRHTHIHTHSYTPVYLTVDIIHITGSITYSCRVFLTSFTKHVFILHSLLSSLWTSLNKLSCEGQIICYLGLQAKISNFFPRKANSLFKFHTLYLKM